jgi:long-subunit acyl-CoA synthetase (AMP-forming)
MTTHANLLTQLEHLDMLPVEPGDVAISYLPPWHAYGRTLE